MVCEIVLKFAVNYFNGSMSNIAVIYIYDKYIVIYSSIKKFIIILFIPSYGYKKFLYHATTVGKVKTA